MSEAVLVPVARHERRTIGSRGGGYPQVVIANADAQCTHRGAQARPLRYNAFIERKLCKCMEPVLFATDASGAEVALDVASARLRKRDDADRRPGAIDPRDHLRVPMPDAIWPGATLRDGADERAVADEKLGGNRAMTHTSPDNAAR